MHKFRRLTKLIALFALILFPGCEAMKFIPSDDRLTNSIYKRGRTENLVSLSSLNNFVGDEWKNEDFRYEQEGRYDGIEYRSLCDQMIVNYACAVSYELRRRGSRNAQLSRFYTGAQDTALFVLTNRALMGVPLSAVDKITAAQGAVRLIQLGTHPKDHRKMFEDAANQIDDAVLEYYQNYPRTKERREFDPCRFYTDNGRTLKLIITKQLRGISRILEGGYPDETPETDESIIEFVSEPDVIFEYKNREQSQSQEPPTAVDLKLEISCKKKGSETFEFTGTVGLNGADNGKLEKGALKWKWHLTKEQPSQPIPFEPKNSNSLNRNSVSQTISAIIVNPKEVTVTLTVTYQNKTFDCEETFPLK